MTRTLQEWLALPEADPHTNACPHCDGRHFAVHEPPGGLPPVYACRGTDDFADGTPGCGRLFRGREGVHYRRENWLVLDGAAPLVPRRVYHRTSGRHDVLLVALVLVLIAVALGTR